MMRRQSILDTLLLIRLAKEAGVSLADVERALMAESEEEAAAILGIPPETGELPYKAGAMMEEIEAIAAAAWGEGEE